MIILKFEFVCTQKTKTLRRIPGSTGSKKKNDTADLTDHSARHRSNESGIELREPG